VAVEDNKPGGLRSGPARRVFWV